MDSKSIDTRIANVKVDENKIIHITFFNAIDIDDFDVLDLNLVIRNLSKNEPSLKLVDTRVKWSISPVAKKSALAQNKLNKTLARAILVSSLPKVALFSFLKKFETKQYPQKYFTNYEEAYTWLLSFN